jgi:protein-S-isoprenylcysteine O-methyltransferase Ste14
VLKSASVLAFAAMVAGIAGLYYARALFGSHPVVIAIQIAAFLLMVAARITFGRRSFHAAANPTSGGVVTTGPYAYVRHPIYAAVIYFVWAGALEHLSWPVFAWAALITAGALVRVFLEERLLIARYPEYRDYEARVRRIVPFVF